VCLNGEVSEALASGTPRGVSRVIFSSLLVKNVLSTHIIVSGARHNYLLCLQRGPYQQPYCVITLLSKGPPTVTAMCIGYSVFKEAPNSNCNVQVLCFQRGPQ